MKTFFTKVLTHSIHHAIIALITFIVLFDQNGGFALGTTIWTTTSFSAVTIAGILGNLLWIFGILLWIASAVVFVISLLDDMIKAAVKEAHTIGKLAGLGKITIYGGFCLYIAGYPKINLADYQIISSGHAKKAFATGIDEGIKLR